MEKGRCGDTRVSGRGRQQEVNVRACDIMDRGTELGTGDCTFQSLKSILAETF